MKTCKTLKFSAAACLITNRPKASNTRKIVIFIVLVLLLAQPKTLMLWGSSSRYLKIVTEGRDKTGLDIFSTAGR